MSESETAAGPAATSAGWMSRAKTRLMPDCNAAAAGYWMSLVLAGGAVITGSALRLSAMPQPHLLQVLSGAVIAAVIGLFPVPVPGSKHSIAAGDIFIFLLLLLHGPAAAVVGAAAEAAVGSWRSSKRWTSRLASPSSAAVAMFACGSLYEATLIALGKVGFGGDGAMLGMVMLFAVGYFVVNTTLITSVV